MQLWYTTTASSLILTVVATTEHARRAFGTFRRGGPHRAKRPSLSSGGASERGFNDGFRSPGMFSLGPLRAVASDISGNRA
jgi:hypothetical protein